MRDRQALLTLPYSKRTRKGMVKVKRLRTPTVFVGGSVMLRRAEVVGSLLLGFI